MRYCAASVYPG